MKLFLRTTKDLLCLSTPIWLMWIASIIEKMM